MNGPPARPPKEAPAGAAFSIQASAFSDPNFQVQTLVNAITFRPLSQQRLAMQSHGGSASTPQSAGGGGPSSAALFDMRPFARCFEETVTDLVRLRKKVQREIDDLEDALTASDTTYKSTLGKLDVEYAAVYTSFETLEDRVSEVGNTAVRIGEQLEMIDKQRSKAADAQELLQFFLDFNKGVSDRLEALRKSPNGQARAAALARRLQQVVRDVSEVPGTETARSEIDRYCELLERELLRDFELATESRDVAGMRQATLVLNEFNGGESAVRAWVSRHPLFVKSGSGPAPTPRPKADLPLNALSMSGDPGLRRLLEQIRATLYQDWDLISTVFSSPITVATQLVQRFFQQLVQAHLDTLFREASMTSDVAYLRMVASAHAAATSLIGDFAHFDSSVLKKDGVMVRVFEQATQEVFASYCSTTDREVSCFQSIVQSTFKETLAYYANRKQQKKSMFARMQKSSAANAPLEHLLSTDQLMLVLAAHAESIDRCLQLHAEPAKAISVVYASVMDALYARYVELALDATWDEVQPVDGTKAEPDFKLLVSVQTANTLVQAMQAHFEARVARILVQSPGIHRAAVELKNDHVARIEARANAIVMHLLAAATTHLQVLLSRQKKTDFRARDGDVDMMGQIATPTCISVCEFLGRLIGHLQSYLDGDNLTSFARELGLRFYTFLLEHLKKFPVSTTGALTLSRDMAKYHDLVATFAVPDLLLRFDLIRELGHLFLVQPQNLPSILQEGLLVSLDNQTLQAYLANRGDWKTARLEDMLQERARMGYGVVIAAYGSGTIADSNMSFGTYGSLQ
ncbi:exocyst complex component Sec10-domain-containing protein [Blastocladiella britannica]|nr:exocyst complex component Sec10-domain-containing protein [Blastocladiella britannica]